MEESDRLWHVNRLAEQMGSDEICIVDVRDIPRYAKGHIPGAVLLQPGQLMSTRPPAMGLLPDEVIMSHLLSVLGIDADTMVVAYDDEGGGWASRLLWNLEAYGHRRSALLDGGWLRWTASGGESSVVPEGRNSVNRILKPELQNVASRAYILDRLGDPGIALIDCRSEPEFIGLDVRARRGGHIPGAVNLDWTEFMDPEHQLCLRSEEDLRSMLTEHGITPDKEVITYCQTNHRSALPWFALKLLGYESVRGYDGAWSDWGNAADTPIAKE